MTDADAAMHLTLPSPALVSLISTARDVAVFVFAVFGVGAACAPRSDANPLQRLLAGTLIAFLVAFAVGFAGFVAGFSNGITAGALAALAIALVALRWRAVRTMSGDPDVRRFFAGWLLFAVWALALLALVVTYSGGGWAADWVEHWQRTLFFLERQPLTTRFAAIYTLPARPPLANLLIALWLETGAPIFSRFQVFITVFGTLILLPAWILARRWSRGPSVDWWVLAVCMASPLVAENLTFAWTKLPTAFFVLAALCFVVVATDRLSPRPAFFAVVALALATLTHYSAIPWVIALAAAYLVATYPSPRPPAFWRSLAVLTVLYVVLITPWIGWTIAHYGSANALGGNTTAGGWHSQTSTEHILVPLRNIFDTIVPFPLRGEPSDGLIEQASRLGRLRDVAFNLYQLNLPFALGLGGLWVLARRAARREPSAPHETDAQSRYFWWTLVPLAIVLGIVVHTPRDSWGLVHICLQPLVLLVLAWIASGLSASSRSTIAVWAVLAAIDLALGIALQFGLESQALARFVSPNPDGFIHALSRSASANANDKAAFDLVFFGDAWRGMSLATVAVLATCIAIVAVRLRRDSRSPA